MNEHESSTPMVEVAHVPESWTDPRARQIAEVRARQRRFDSAPKVPWKPIGIAGGAFVVVAVLVAIIGRPELAFLSAAVVAGLVINFIPTCVAWSRNHRNLVGIFLVNLFLGWTLIGWVGALVWAVYQERKS